MNAFRFTLNGIGNKGGRNRHDFVGYTIMFEVYTLPFTSPSFSVFFPKFECSIKANAVVVISTFGIHYLSYYIRTVALPYHEDCFLDAI